MTIERKEKNRALKFTLFSASAGIIQEGTFLLMYNVLHWDWWPSHLISLALSVVYNFTVNRTFTFHSAANVPVAMAKVFAYYCVFTPISVFGGRYLTDQCGWNGNLVQILTMLLNFVTEFLFTRFVVYGKQVDNDGTVPKEKTV